MNGRATSRMSIFRNRRTMPNPILGKRPISDFLRLHRRKSVPTPPSEVGPDSTVGNTNKSSYWAEGDQVGSKGGGGGPPRAAETATGAKPEGRRGPPADQLGTRGAGDRLSGRGRPDAVDAAAARIRMVEQIVASITGSGRTRSEALAHLAKIGQIELDAGWVYRLGYR